MTDEMQIWIFDKNRYETLKSLGKKIDHLLRLGRVFEGRANSKSYEETQDFSENKLPYLKNAPQFTDEIFMGNGDFSTAAGTLLFLDLNNALETLSYKQQNGGQGYEFDEKSDQDAQAKLEKISRSIVHALGCKDILKEEGLRVE